MALDDFEITERKNQVYLESGMDSLRYCKDKEHFKSYPHRIKYQFNSRGFRDDEWPEDLLNSIWCIGDSFTVGVGAPISHTWPNILQAQTTNRCINVSLDGASNQWISRRACQILEEIQPKIMVIHWSYIHRSEDTDQSKTDSARRMFLDREHTDLSTQIGMFNECIRNVESKRTKTVIVHSTIPGAIEPRDAAFETWEGLSLSWDQVRGDGWPRLPTTIDEIDSLPKYITNELKQFGLMETIRGSIELFNNPQWLEYRQLAINHNFIDDFEILDFARDGHHYDILTATTFVKRILEKIKK